MKINEFIIAVTLILIGGAPVFGQHNEIREADLIGDWYLISPTKNCHILLGDKGLMTVVTSTGSFFGKEECIKASWKLIGDKIALSDAPVEGVLGKKLLILQDKGEAVLVPQNEQEQNTKNGAKFRYCFRRKHH